MNFFQTPSKYLFLYYDCKQSSAPQLYGVKKSSGNYSIEKKLVELTPKISMSTKSLQKAEGAEGGKAFLNEKPQ